VISDGSKPDLCRLQCLFDNQVNVAVQDPVYPAYVDGSVIAVRVIGEELNINNITTTSDREKMDALLEHDGLV
jgi:hypothetical protein